MSDKPRKKRVVMLGMVGGIILACLLVSNTFFGPQTRAEQSATLRTEAEKRLREGHRKEAIEKLKLALKLNPSDAEARRRYDELTSAGR